MDHQKKYELCILIPCYNNLPGLKKSLASIRYDAEKYFILIVDDGSEKVFGTHDLFEEKLTQPATHIIQLAKNSGITIALNTGLQWIKDNIVCTYVARLDCGDVCDPSRFYEQMNYLSENPQIDLLGSWCVFQDPGTNFRFRYKAPAIHKAIKRCMYFKNAFIHPTVVFRFDAVEKLGFYPDQYPFAEDYALFWKIINSGQTAILPSYLVVCELNVKGISFTNRIKQLRSRLVILQNFGTTFTLKLLGSLKIKILMKTPYSFILRVKKVMFL